MGTILPSAADFRSTRPYNDAVFHHVSIGTMIAFKTGNCLNRQNAMKDCMMKIDHLSPNTTLGRSSSRKPAGPDPSGSEFQKLFNETLDRKTDISAPSSPVAPSPVFAPIAIDGTRAMDRGSGIQAMEGFIDALETYQRRLADPHCQLRDIAPALEDLEKAHQHLSRFAAETPAESILGAIMNEGLITAAMEIRRFNSGAYC